MSDFKSFIDEHFGLRNDLDLELYLPLLSATPFYNEEDLQIVLYLIARIEDYEECCRGDLLNLVDLVMRIRGLELSKGCKKTASNILGVSSSFYRNQSIKDRKRYTVGKFQKL